MDRLDQKLLKELDINPRIPLSRLGRKLRVSQQVIDYRLKRMFEQGSVTKLATIINLKALWLEHYRIFFTFHSKKEFSSSEVFYYLKSRKGVYWAARIGGRYDLLVVLFVRDFEGFDRAIEEFYSRFPGLIKDYKACYVTEHKIYTHKFLSNEAAHSGISYGYNDKPAEIDELDKTILHKIKDNCRLSALEISRVLPEGKGVTYKTIINRIRTMEKNKVILGYRPFISSSEHRPFVVLLSFKNYSRKEEKQLIEYLGSRKEATQIARLFGTWNLFIHVRIKDNERLQELLIELRDKFGIIDEHEIIPVFEDIAINLMPM